jgi:hypothetical protein
VSYNLLQYLLGFYRYIPRRFYPHHYPINILLILLVPLQGFRPLEFVPSMDISTATCNGVHSSKLLKEPKIGGAFRIDINDSNIAVGEYVELVPYEKVVLTWGWTHSQLMPPGSSTVEFRLYPEANGTRLVLTHFGLPVAGMPSQLQGWLHYTSRLQAVAQGRDPGPDPYATPPGR